jgi:hypothetical protein
LERFYLQRREEKGFMWSLQGDSETSGPMGQDGDWVFIAFFYIAPGQRYLSGADRSFLGRRGVS